MNIKRLIYAIFASYVIMAVIGIAADIFLAAHTVQLKAIGRMGADLEAHAVWLYLGYFIVTILFCYIYVHHHEGKGWKEGARYGFLIGLLMAGMTMVYYSFLPMDGMESLVQAALGIIIYMAGGIVTALVYKTEN